MLNEKLINIQKELKAPKGQYNFFGKYSYRSCEDILEAVKPLLVENKLMLYIFDTLEYIGERYYIKASAVLKDLEGNEIVNTAYAREEETKKGMDGSQITGTASSYARKYALNGLFLIDDTKDADTDEYTETTKEMPKATDKQKELIKDLYDAEEIKLELTTLQKAKLSDLTIKEASDLISKRKGE